jgi:hypothetical protein
MGNKQVLERHGGNMPNSLSNETPGNEYKDMSSKWKILKKKLPWKDTKNRNGFKMVPLKGYQYDITNELIEEKIISSNENSDNNTPYEILHKLPRTMECINPENAYLFSIDIHEFSSKNIGAFLFLKKMLPREINPRRLDFFDTLYFINEEVILISVDDLFSFRQKDHENRRTTYLVLNQITCVILFGSSNSDAYATEDALKSIAIIFPNVRILIVNCQLLNIWNFSILEKLTHLSILNVGEMLSQGEEKLTLPGGLTSFVLGGIVPDSLIIMLPENQTSSLKQV